MKTSNPLLQPPHTPPLFLSHTHKNSDSPIHTDTPISLYLYLPSHYCQISAHTFETLENFWGLILPKDANQQRLRISAEQFQGEQQRERQWRQQGGAATAAAAGGRAWPAVGGDAVPRRRHGNAARDDSRAALRAALHALPPPPPPAPAPAASAAAAAPRRNRQRRWI